MSTEEMMNMRGSVPVDDRPAFQQEMQKRMQNMSPEERQKYMQTKGMGQGRGMGQGQGMGMGQKRMMNQPTFDQYDLNNDGKITQSELDEARAKRMSQNAKDGKMMRNAQNAPALTDMDIDKDGTLNQEEFRMHQAEQMKMKNKGNNPGMGQGKGMRKNAGNAPAFSDIDTNNDGTISQEEFSSHQTKRMQNKGN